MSITCSPPRWVNQLTGWTSTCDPLENVGRSSLLFRSKEEALAFAAKAGWEAEVVEPNLRELTRPKRWTSYGEGSDRCPR